MFLKLNASNVHNVACSNERSMNVQWTFNEHATLYTMQRHSTLSLYIHSTLNVYNERSIDVQLDLCTFNEHQLNVHWTPIERSIGVHWTFNWVYNENSIERPLYTIEVHCIQWTFNWTSNAWNELQLYTFNVECRCIVYNSTESSTLYLPATKNNKYLTFLYFFSHGVQRHEIMYQ